MSDTPSSLRYRLVQRSLRPPRAATIVCAKRDWRADLLRMMECYSRTWGGNGNALPARTPAAPPVGPVRGAVAAVVALARCVDEASQAPTPYCGVR
jgi:hypothetical protein